MILRAAVLRNQIHVKVWAGTALGLGVGTGAHTFLVWPLCPLQSPPRRGARADSANSQSRMSTNM